MMFINKWIITLQVVILIFLLQIDISIEITDDINKMITYIEKIAIQYPQIIEIDVIVNLA